MSTQTPSSIWKGSISSILALFLVVVLAIVFAFLRAMGMLLPSMRLLLPLSFVLMTVMPWILLTGEGRNQIGLVWPSHNRGFGLALILGSISAVICFALGLAIFGNGPDNWFMSIANNYKSIMDTSGFSMTRLHLIFTLPALIFSPIGEEIFFRGLLQRALEEHLTKKSSTLIECALFASIHLFHHGILRTSIGIIVLPISGFCWVGLMFLVALLFAWLRRSRNSLYPAMVSHASFNLAMNITIFSILWRYVT